MKSFLKYLKFLKEMYSEPLDKESKIELKSGVMFILKMPLVVFLLIGPEHLINIIVCKFTESEIIQTIIFFLYFFIWLIFILLYWITKDLLD